MNFDALKTNLEKKGYTVSVFATAAEATDYLNGKIDGKTVGFGGSVTLDKMGVYEKLATHNECFWHWRVPEGKTALDMRNEGNAAAVYLSSVNGVAETGEIIRENSRAYGCTSWKSREEPGCGYVIWKRVAGRTITPELARQLIQNGRTNEVISGFRSRAGKPFRARLVLNDEGKVEFDFPARAQTKEPAVAE
jgi:hypothetical protein